MNGYKLKVKDIHLIIFQLIQVYNSLKKKKKLNFE